MNQPSFRPPREALSVSTDGPTAHGQIEQLAALLDVLDVGLVTVDPLRDFAVVNASAAALLAVPAGVTTASEFGAVIEALAGRALNRDEATEQLGTLDRDPGAQFRTVWTFPQAPTHLGVVSQRAPYPGFDGRIWAFYDNSPLAEAIDAGKQAEELFRASADAMLDPQVLVEGVWRDGHIVDLVYRNANRATCEYLGMGRDELIGRSLLESLPNLRDSGLLARYARCAETGEAVILDGFAFHNEVLDDTRFYDIRGAQVRPGWMTLTWRDVTERSQWTRRVALSEQRFRLLAENVADVVVRIIDGRVSWISNTVENALDAPADYWIGRRAMDFVAPDQADSFRSAAARIAGGGSYAGRTRIVGADGRQHWVHMHAKPFHEADGTVNGSVTSFRVIDDDVAAELRARDQIALRDAQNRSLNRRLQDQTDRLMSELKSAARYVASILPGDLDGPVAVSSRFVPSRYLGGDSYDYRWIDDDHLMVYLVDVSGHGVESAMLSVSVHNLLRSGTLSWPTLLQPDAVLTELNRLFQMDQHDGNYFTIWYGVYESSARLLRYACAGHPPALALSRGPAVTATPLAAQGLPIGTFDDAAYATGTFPVPPGTEVLLYSDGAFELDPDAGQWDPREFTALCTEVAGSPDWSLDDLISRLAAATADGIFQDDCTLVRLSFD